MFPCHGVRLASETEPTYLINYVFFDKEPGFDAISP